MTFTLASNVFALDLPRKSSYDPHIQYVDYNEDDVVQINAYPGIATQIVLANNEEILDIASGFSAGWEFSNRRNHLYLKPKSVRLADNAMMEPQSGKWDTNLIVTTNLRVYAFHLVLPRSDGKFSANPKIAFRVAFRYPADDAAKAKAAAEKQAARDRMEQTPPPRNWSYSMQVGENSDEIAPTMAYDDGRFTYLRFPGNREFPAVFVVAPDKTESIVNTHIDPRARDVLVIHRVAREFVLRLGQAVVGVYNDAFDPIGIPADGGTSVPGVKRSVKQSGAGSDEPDNDASEAPTAPPAPAQSIRARYLPPGHPAAGNASAGAEQTDNEVENGENEQN
ncbi:MAG: P-type conjugative transfer protein VirB9 [Candidatus Accumulibacter sp.]|nr:P-type conjugative transfer protein VirB9 [Accumulibacter sp.]